ncbi:MAG: diacylglycerol kinase [Fusobacteriaceae bacterium]|jgi:diacylglycerol kinase (ATP)|nr:diacylglycerol kinase [Fusobacteriaceae bacterium]
MDGKKWKKHSYIDGLNTAIMGIIDAIRTEYHMKFHCFCTVIVITVCVFLNVTKTEILILSLSIGFVWVTELFNTAIETAVDLVTDQYSDLAKRAKDIASGAVLVAAVNAIVCGILIFGKSLEFQIAKNLARIQDSNPLIFLLIITAIVIVVLVLKIVFKKGTPLKGGLPSGHSALAASLFTIISVITRDTKIVILAFLMLVLIMQSRVEGRIHTLLETVLGALIGWVVTYSLLLLFIK